MSKRIDNGIKSAEAVTERVKQWGSEHLAGILSIILLFGLGIYLCCDLSINKQTPPLELLSDIAFRFVVTMSYWLNFYYSGITRGHKTDDYVNAKLHFSKIMKAITDAGKIGAVQGFCVDYVKEDLESYRRGLVESVGIAYEDFCNKYQSMTIAEIKAIETYEVNGEQRRLNDIQKRYLVYAIKARPMTLTQDMLIGGNDMARRKRMLSPSEAKLNAKSTITKAIRLIVMTTLSALWAVKLIINFTPDIVGVIAIMIIIISIAGFGGWINGYRTATEGAVANYNDRADKLTIFCDRNGVETKKERQSLLND